MVIFSDAKQIDRSAKKKNKKTKHTGEKIPTKRFLEDAMATMAQSKRDNSQVLKANQNWKENTMHRETSHARHN